MRIFYGAAGFIFYCMGMGAMPSVSPDPIPCVMRLETGFFIESIVNQGLSLYDVRQELWVPINAALQVKNLEVPDRMKQRTAYMVPNPIEYPMQKGLAAKILKDVLYEVFSEVMIQYHTNEISNTKMIFEYIFSRRFPEFVDCFGPEALPLKPKGLI